MAEGYAESLESLARYTRSYRAYLLLDADLEMVRRTKGPVRREDLRPWGPRSTGRGRDGHRSPWEGKRSLRLTISSQAQREEDAVANELIGLARLHLVEVDGSEVDAAGAGAISLRHRDAEHWDLVTSREPHTTHFLLIEPHFLDMIVSEIAETDRVDIATARQTTLDIEAHRALKNDLFVTTSHYLLSRRFSSRGWPGPVGVVTPLEAVEITYAFLRSRDDFTLQAPPAHVTVGSTLFYSAVARSLMPTATRALRHLLSPRERQHGREAADHLLGVFSRMHDLLVASDHLRVLAQLEAHLGAGNNVVAQQLYHLQNSLVLFTGALDVMAWVIASLDGQTPARVEVSWRTLDRERGWRTRATDPRALALLTEARTRDRGSAIIDLTTELRDTFQHRHPLVAGVAEFLNDLGLTEACIGIVDLTASVGHRLAPQPGVPGIVSGHAQDLAIPHRLQRGLIDVLAHTVERVFAVVAWPEGDWWADPEGGLRWPKIEAEVLRLLGEPAWDDSAALGT